MLHRLSLLPYALILSLFLAIAFARPLVELNALTALNFDHSKLSNATRCRQEDALNCYWPNGIKRKSGVAPPGTNGCGPGGMFENLLNPTIAKYLPYFVPCCDDHDRCYGTCGSTFEGCNSAMASCMVQACPNAACRELVAPVFDTAVTSPFACDHYLKGVTDNCECDHRLDNLNGGEYWAYFKVDSFESTEIVSPRADTLYIATEVLLNSVGVDHNVRPLGRHGKTNMTFTDEQTAVWFKPKSGDTIKLSFLLTNRGSDDEQTVLDSLNNALPVGCSVGNVCYQVAGSDWVSKAVSAVETAVTNAWHFATSFWNRIFGSCDRPVQGRELILTFDDFLAALSTDGKLYNAHIPHQGIERFEGTPGHLEGTPRVCHIDWTYNVYYSFGYGYLRPDGTKSTAPVPA